MELDNNTDAIALPSDATLTGVTITIEYMSRKCLMFDSVTNQVTLDVPFPKKLMSATSYYIFQSFGTATFPEPLCPNDSIAALRARQNRQNIATIVKKKTTALNTRTAQEMTIMADVWGPPCKIQTLGDKWNVETLSGPQV